MISGGWFNHQKDQTKMEELMNIQWRETYLKKKMLLGDSCFNLFCVHNKLNLSFSDLNWTTKIFILEKIIFTIHFILAWNIHIRSVLVKWHPNNFMYWFRPFLW